MAILDIRWESEEEREVVKSLLVDWEMYGEIHMTNSKGVTRLDPAGVTYRPTGREVQPSPSATSSPE